MPGNMLLLRVLVCALKHIMTCTAFPLAVGQQTLGVGGDIWMPTWGNYRQIVNHYARGPNQEGHHCGGWN